jgi:hypothetical protein
MDSMYVWARIAVLGCLGINLMRRNYALKTYAKLFAGYFVVANLIPFTYYNVLELNRMRLMKNVARKYYNFENGDMSRVQFIMDPNTPLSKLRYFSL